MGMEVRWGWGQRMQKDGSRGFVEPEEGHPPPPLSPNPAREGGSLGGSGVGLGQAEGVVLGRHRRDEVRLDVGALPLDDQFLLLRLGEGGRIHRLPAR